MCKKEKTNKKGSNGLVYFKNKIIFAPSNNRGRVPQINQIDYVSKN